jgi:proliferating cell nuclear antigen
MMHLCTIKATAVKNVFETLKDILNDCNLIFSPTGVSLCTLDTARTSLIDMRLNADDFEEYACSEEEIVCGINVSNFFKLLKSVTNSDVLRLSIKCKEFLTVEITSEGKKTSTTYELKLLDINESRIEVPNIDMTTVCTTTLPSSDFQRLCRDMSNIGSEISIVRKQNILRLSCAGDFANQETTIETVESIDHDIHGLYSLRYLNIFTKATSMANTVQILQEKENRFLILKYMVANLGDIKFYLATKIDESQ